MRITNTFGFVTLISLLGFISCKQVVIPDAELPAGWGSGEKVSKEFKVDNIENLGLPSVDEGTKISVFSTMSPGENCEFTYQNGVFSGEVSEGGSFIALYPYREDASLVNEGGKLVLTTSIPSEQGLFEIIDESSDINGVSRQANDITEDNAVTENKLLDELYLSVDSGDGFEFNSLYSSITLPIESEYDLEIDSIRVQANNSEHLSGEIGLTFSGVDYSGIKTPEIHNPKLLYIGNLDLKKGRENKVRFNILPEKYKNGFTVSLFKGKDEIKQEYTEEIDLSNFTDLTLDKFEVSLPEYYISYVSDQEINIDGYISEYSEGEGKIYFSSNKVPDALFQNQTSLTEVTIPSSIQTIGQNVFQGCTSLSTVHFEEGLVTIDKFAFNNTAIVDLIIPSSVTTINGDAFSEIQTLKTLQFGEVTYQEDNNNGEEKITNVTSTSKLKTLGYTVFRNSVLTSDGVFNIVFPETLEQITQTFSGFAPTQNFNVYFLGSTPPKNNNATFPTGKLNYIFVPQEAVESYKQNMSSFSGKIYEIGSDPTAPQRTEYYMEYTSATEITVGGVYREYDEVTDEGKIYFSSSVIPAKTFQKQGLNFGEIKLHGITKIENDVFDRNGGTNNVIQSIDFGRDLIEIGNYAFQEVTLGGKLEFPTSLQKIGTNAFRNTQITSVQFGNAVLSGGVPVDGDPQSSLETLNDGCFNGCKKLTGDIVIPSGTTRVGKAFNAPHENLNIYFISEEALKGLTKDSFHKNATITIYVPQGKAETYAGLIGNGVEAVKEWGDNSQK